MQKKGSVGVVRLRLRAGVLGGFALAGIALGSFPRLTGFEQSARKSTENPVASRGKLVQELFLAIDHRDTKAVEDLLKAGADPNSRNGLDFTPIFIAAASHQPEVVDLLLKAGAQYDAPSIYGTPLTFAAATANLPDAKRFLSMGAKPDFQRNDGLTPLMMAANSGSPDFVAELLSHMVDVNLQDDGGQTALHFAALNGWTEVAKQLLAAGAKVDMADEEGHTPLMTAAQNGRAEFVQALIEKGADVNAKDSAGRTAAILAASYGDNPDVIKALQAAKADMSVKDSAGRTAADVAHMKGYAQAAALLGAPVEGTLEPRRSATDAVNLSLKLIAANTRQFEEGATCISCHHEGLGRMATGEAKARGFRVDEAVEKGTMSRINGVVVGIRPLVEQALVNREVMKQLPLIEINEVTPMATWVLAGMAGQNQPPTAATAAMAMVLARQQTPAGCWTFSLPRVPMQSSFFTFTALSAKALATYGPKASSAEISDRLANAKKWFLEAKPQNSEDRASRLLGLKWSGASMDDRKASVADILADQKSDGGWSQLPNGPSDAYATGQALYALRVGGGMSASDPVYQKGVRYLLLTQDDDGSWYTGKRALPVNNYFDAGFPHGESQYASFNATCWATLALLGDSKAK